MDKKTSTKWELIRFLICGVAAALTDYLACQLMIMIIGNNLDKTWLTIVSTAVGFVFGVVVNYLISTYWVYQNVDKSVNTKSTRFIVLFVLLSLAAMALSIGAMLLCDLVIVHGMAMASIVELSVMDLIKGFGWGFLAQGIFWAYFISFCIKTIVGLVFNYFTRKYILYKAPKEENALEKE